MVSCFNQDIWNKAIMVQSMNAAELMNFYYMEGFKEQVKILLEWQPNLVTGNFERNGEAVTKDRMSLYIYILNTMMINTNFRSIMMPYMEQIEYLNHFHKGKLDGTVDAIELFRNIPIRSVENIRDYLTYTGLLDSLLRLSALLTADSRYVQVDSFLCKGKSYRLEVKPVGEELQKKLFAQYSLLKTLKQPNDVMNAFNGMWYGREVDMQLNKLWNYLESKFEK